jgi:6-pyruvoyltetrahydropterin/6-carboxytetrahydropterin synthase
MPWTIEKHFDFEASHRLPHVPAGHKCGRMHGHSYRVVFRLETSQLLTGEDAGMVFEYGKLAAVVSPLVDALDHRTLNDVRGLDNPTTEILARWFFDSVRASLPFLAAVVVYESRTTRCEYRA